jgi:hypothetical protein
MEKVPGVGTEIGGRWWDWEVKVLCEIGRKGWDMKRFSDEGRKEGKEKSEFDCLSGGKEGKALRLQRTR